MTISITATLVCDSRRGPGCEWTLDLGAGRDPAVVARRRREAEDLGWLRVPVPAAREGDPPTWVDLCPGCSRARTFGADVLPPASAGASPIPGSIGEAAELARRRGSAAGGG